MSEQEIIEGNKFIAEFMGAKLSDRSTLYYLPYAIYGYDSYNRKWRETSQYHFDDLRYNYSWDWLMPVVEKIEHLNEDKHNLGRIEVNSHYCSINSLAKNQPKIIIGCYKNSPEKLKCSTKIEAVWLAVVEFIKWYNQNKK